MQRRCQEVIDKCSNSLKNIIISIHDVGAGGLSNAVPEIVNDSLAKLKGLKTIWMQIGIKHESSAQKARQLGLNVIEDRCPKIEHQRLFGELRKAGFATNIISSRL